MRLRTYSVSLGCRNGKRAGRRISLARRSVMRVSVVLAMRQKLGCGLACTSWLGSILATGIVV